MAALGSLVVQLALNYAQYKEGLKEGEQATLEHAKKVQDTMDGLESRLMGLAGRIAGGLAAGYTMSVFADMVVGAVESGAALHNLSKETGATVEGLSSLLIVGKSTGIGSDELRDALNDLTSKMVEVEDGSSDVGAALQAIGINIKEFKALSPDQQMLTVAQAMDKFADGAGKTSVAMALYGDEGARLIPMLGDLATQQDLQIKVTAEQAAAADRLKDNVLRLDGASNAWLKQIANGLIPAIDDGTQALTNMMRGTGGLTEEAQKLSGDGSISDWAESAIVSLSYVADVVHGLLNLFPALGKLLGGIAAGGAALASAGSIKEAREALASIGSDVMADLDALLNPRLIGQRYRDELAKVKAQEPVPEAAKSQINHKPPDDKPATGKTGAAQAQQSLLDKINARITATNAELTAGRQLTEVEKLQTEVLEQLTSGKVKMTAAQQNVVKARLGELVASDMQLSAQRQELALSRDLAAIRRQQITDAEKSASDLIAGNAALRDEIEAMTIGVDAQQRMAIARNNSAIATKQSALAELQLQSAITGTQGRAEIALAAEVAALQERNELIGAKAATAEYQDNMRAALGYGRTLFDDLLSGGNSAVKRLGQSIKTYVTDMLYQLTIKPWIINIGASISGATLSSAAQATSGSVGGGGTLSAISAGKGIYDAISGGFTKLGASVTSEFSAFAVSSAGQSMGLSTAVEAMGPVIEGGLAPTMNVMTESAASMASAAGSFAAGASGVMAGVTLGSAIAGDKVVFGMDGTTTSAIGSAIGLALGGPVGAVIGGTIGGVVNAAFGMGPKKTTAEGLKGTLNASAGAAVQSYTSWHQDGGWFRDDKDGTNYSAVTSSMQQYLDYSVVGLTSTTKAYAKALALGADAVSSYSQAIDVDLRGLDSAAQKTAIDAALVGFGDGLAQQLLGTFETVTTSAASSLPWAQWLSGQFGAAEVATWKPGEFVKDGETASVALKRLATSLVTVNSAFDALGQTAFATSLVGADNASKLMDVFAAKFAPGSTDASAGMNSFSQLSASYFDAFYSDEEKRQQQIKTINAATVGSGLDAATATRDSFRALVDAQDVTTESGRAMYATLLGASSAFATLTQSASNLADAVKSSVSEFSTLQEYQFAQDMANTAIGKAMGRQLGIPGFATGGDHVGGLRVVGEHGPELELTGAARIFSANQTRKILSGSREESGNAARLDAIRDELSRLNTNLANLAANNSAEGRSIAGHVAKAADALQEMLDDGLGVKNTRRGDVLTVLVGV